MKWNKTENTTAQCTPKWNERNWIKVFNRNWNSIRVIAVLDKSEYSPLQWIQTAVHAFHGNQNIGGYQQQLFSHWTARDLWLKFRHWTQLISIWTLNFDNFRLENESYGKSFCVSVCVCVSHSVCVCISFESPYSTSTLIFGEFNCGHWVRSAVSVWAHFHMLINSNVTHSFCESFFRFVYLCTPHLLWLFHA